MPEAINYYFDKYFHVITAFVILIVLLFFSADQVIGAAGLRAYYLPVGTGFGVGCLIWLVLVFRHNQMSGTEKLTAALIVVALIGAPIFIKALAPVMIISIAVGWITSVLTGAIVIPAYAIASLMVGVVILQLILNSTSSLSGLRKTISTLLLIYMAGFSMGLASLPRYGFSVLDESYQHDDHQYLLYIQYSGLDDDDTVQLYECNTIGIACKVIFEDASSGHYAPSTVSIKLDADTNTVGVQIENKPSQKQSTNEDSGT